MARRKKRHLGHITEVEKRKADRAILRASVMCENYPRGIERDRCNAGVNNASIELVREGFGIKGPHRRADISGKKKYSHMGNLLTPRECVERINEALSKKLNMTVKELKRQNLAIPMHERNRTMTQNAVVKACQESSKVGLGCPCLDNRRR